VSEVDRAIEAAIAALDEAPDGWLGLPERRRLREAMGPWTPAYEPGGPDAGLLRRAELHAAAARRALPVWEAAFPGDRRPHDLIESVLATLRSGWPQEGMSAAAAPLEDDLERMAVEPDRREAFNAGMAAVHLSAEAADGDLDPALYPPETLDDDLDEPLVETLAAWALAEDDAEGTRAYWRWYVTEAFPAAYAAAP
jgi:hypothetical protein